MIEKIIKKIYSNSKKTNSLDSIFYPKSIAIIGASSNIEKIGGYIFSQIKKLEDIKAYPINLNSNLIQNILAFPNIRAINDNIDLAIIVVPAKFVINAIQDCIIAKVKNIIVISAGFKEIGEEGKILENKLKELINKNTENKINLIGPNCLGILNAENNLNCSFAKDIPKYGDIALISQSGAVIDAIIDWSFKYQIGFSKIISMGNMAGVSELQILNYLKDDPKTKAIVFYMETLENGVEFGKVLNQVSKTKPVIIIKPGKSKNAQKAIGSHTGSLAQDNKLVEILIKENNGIFIDSLPQLYDIIHALKSKYNDNENLVILTNAGGPGVIATDILELTKFKMYQFSEKEKTILKQYLPNEASVNNPIDILGDAKSDRYYNILNCLENFKDIKNILVLLTPQIMTDSIQIAKKIVEINKKSNKNIFSCFLGDKEIRNAINYFNENKFSNFQTPTDALIAMNYLKKYKSFKYENLQKKMKFDSQIINQINYKLSNKKGLLDYNLTREILNAIDVKIIEKKIIRDKKDIQLDLIEKNKKYVLKVDSKELIHKKDVGGVILNIDFSNFLEKANQLFENISKITTNFTITIEQEVKGVETIIGLKKTKHLGNFIMFGMGGTYVSIFKDINFSQAPLNLKSAQKIVEKSKIYKILKGYRGSEKINFEKLYDILIKISYLLELFPQISEVDLNPLICSKKDIYLVDVKLIAN